MKAFSTLGLAGLALVAACGGSTNSDASATGGSGAGAGDSGVGASGGTAGGGTGAAPTGGIGAAPGGGVGAAPGGGGTSGVAGMCDTGSAGVAGAFYNPGTVFCQGRTPMIADVKGFPASKPECSGATPFCTVADCAASTDPVFCCGGKTPVCQACPAGMVSTGTFCIDEHEVTRAEYAAFVATNPTPTASCPSFEPDPNCMKLPEVCQSSCDQHPQVCVSVCATSLCARQGKSFCTVEQLTEACGANAYPYGATYDPLACNGVDSGTGTTAPVGSFGTCAAQAFGGQVFDLSGNVAEWSVVAVGGFEAIGGSFAEGKEALTCGAAAPSAALPSPSVGFRCCTPK